MIMFSIFKIHPEGRAEFVSDAGSPSSANVIAAEYSAVKPFHCVIRGATPADVRHFRNGQSSDN